MPKKELILDFAAYDVNRVVADIEEIRRYNPQRFEMEQLTSICYEDPERMIAVGCKDMTDGEFWVRGHMPGTPLLPGVIMCEIAAQTCGFMCGRNTMLGPGLTLGFGGLNEVRFRGVVVPGKRLAVVCQVTKLRKGAMVTCRFQAFVDQGLVGEGEILGVALPLDKISGAANPS